MAIADDASHLLFRLQAGLSAEDAFLAVFSFIDCTPDGRFGWFSLGDRAVRGVECDSQIRKWRDRLRESINEQGVVTDLPVLANLGGTLSAINAANAITPENSKCLVIALRTLDAAFIGVNMTDVSFSDDQRGLVRLRKNLWRSEPLFSQDGLRVYPKPTRSASPERRGQSRLTELLDVLTVVRDTRHLRVEVRSLPSVAKVDHDGFRRIGIIPTIQHARELCWAREPNDRYSIAEHEVAEEIHARVRTALDALLERGAKLIVLPELVSGESLVRMLKGYLLDRTRLGLATPELLLAGTFMAADTKNGPRRNRAIVLDGEGIELWRQDKMHAYRFNAADQSITGHPLGRDDLTDRDEDIAIEPRTLVAVDLSPSQRVVVLTCEDFIQEDPHRPTVNDLFVTTLLVPIMAPARHEPPAQAWIRDAAMNYVRHPGATSVVANSGALLVQANSHHQWWQLGDILSSPRLTPTWEPVPGSAGQPPVAWLLQLDRAV